MNTSIRISIVLVLAVIPCYSLAPVRVAESYEDTLRVVIAFHEATSLCVQAGGLGRELMELALNAIDTSRVGKAKVMYHARDLQGFDRLNLSDFVGEWGNDSLPHVVLFCFGDSRVNYYSNTINSFLEWAGEKGIGIVAIGPFGATWQDGLYGGKQSFFYTDTLTTLGDSALYDGRWLDKPGDSLFVRCRPSDAIPDLRGYYPNVNGVVRNTITYILPQLQPVSNATVYLRDMGGAGRCKAPGVSYYNPSPGRYTFLAWQQGYNAQADTLYKQRKESDGTTIYEPIPQPVGSIGNPTQYQAIAVYQDTITTFYYDNSGRRRDPRSGLPVARRVVMLNFNPAYLSSRVVAEQLVYDAAMYASTVHRIGAPLVASTPPGPLDIVARRDNRAAHASYRSSSRLTSMHAYTITGRRIPGRGHTPALSPGVYVITDGRIAGAHTMVAPVKGLNREGGIR